LFGNHFWKNFQGNAHQWKNLAETWLANAKEFIPKCHQPTPATIQKVTLVSKPSFVIKGNAGDAIQVPFTFKNESSYPLQPECFVGLTNRDLTYTNVIIGDAPLGRVV